MDQFMINMLWLTIASAMVFLMQAGFMCLEVGLTRSKNTINVAVKNIMDFVISILLFWFIGYGIAFGYTWSGFFGTSDFSSNFINNENIGFFIFQAMFCATAVTIISGAVAERLKFWGYIVIATFVSSIIYVFIAHWAWNGINNGVMSGFLGKQGFYDFAGSTVVHSVGGWCALAALIVLGPRLGRFSADGKVNNFTGNNIPFALLGVFILWFGWFGFNGGALLEFNDQVPLVILNTLLAAAAGCIATSLIGWMKKKKLHLLHTIMGTLAGLVAITACANIVSPQYAVLIGAMSGLIAYAIEHVLIHFQIDDAVNAVPVHLGGGIWGTLCVGIFGQPEKMHIILSPLQLIIVQIEGIIVCGLWSFGLTYLFLKVINIYFPLRISREDEEIGLNISEHGATTELSDLFDTMDRQFTTQDLTLRAPINSFSESGDIAVRYNRVMQRLEDTDKLKKESQKQLAQSQKMKAVGQLSAGIAHDYNNMLAIILGYSDLLKNILPDQPKMKEYVNHIQNAAQRGAKLTKKLLSFTREKPIHAKSVDMNIFIQSQLLMLETTLTARIQLMVSKEQTLWPILVDEGDLEDTIINMSINAMHAMKDGGQLTIQTRNVQLSETDAKIISLKAGDYATLIFRDTGSGISTDIINKIFDPFFTTKGEHGTGLGLSQVYAFVERSGGTINVSSEAGKGACFTLYFPRYCAHDKSTD